MRKHLLLIMMLVALFPWSLRAQSLNEGFESTTFPPDEWTAEKLSGTVSWDRNTSYKKSGLASASVNYASAGHENYLITPKLVPAAGDSLSFYVSSQTYSGTTLTIEVSTTNNQPSAFTTVLETYTTGSSGNIGTTSISTFVEKTISLGAYVGQQIYVAFHVVDNNGSRVCIDDVTGVSLFVPTCPKPTELAVSDITSAGATLSWTSSASNFVVAYGTGTDPDQMTTVNAATNSIALTGLNANTVYNAYVKAVCSETDESDWSGKATFRTDCAAIDLTTLGTIGFETSEGFVSGTNPSSPNCWTFGNMQSTSTSYIPYIYNSSSSAYEGNNSLRLYASKSSSTDADSAYAAMPEFSATNLSQYMLRFYARQGSTSSTYAKNLVVGVMTDPMDMSTFVQVGSANVVGTTYAQYEVSLASYSGNGSYIAFLAAVDPESTASYRYAQYYVDDLVVMVIPSCVRPADVAVSDITSVGATLSWTSSASNFVVAYGTGTDPDQMTTVNAATNSIALTGLNANTVYNAYVKTVCSETDESEWSIMATFRTDCAAIDLTTLGTIGFETSEGFVSGTNPSSPNCWTFGNMQSASTSYIPYIYNSSSSAYEGNNSLRLYASKSSSTDADSAYAAMPEFSATNLSQYMLRFYARQGSTSSAYAKNLVVGVMTDPMDMSTFVQVGSANVVGTTYAQYEVSLASYSGNGNYIAFLAAVDPESTASTRYAQYYVDNLVVMVIPSCVRPADVAAANISSSSAEISWVAGGTETSWNIQYRVAGGENEWVTINNVTANPYTFTGLTAATDYEVQVQAACSATEQSEYSNSATFTTLCEAVATFPYVENFDGLTTNGQIPNCWNNDEGTTTTDTYKWNYDSSHGTGVTGKCIRFNSYNNSNGMTNFLKSPVLALPAGQIMMLSFQWKNPTGGDFSVYISTDGGQTHETALATGLTAQSSWKSEEISLAAYRGQNVVIVFKGTSNWGSGDAYIYLDDVTVYEAPSCIKPSNLAVANVTPSSAEISWVAGGTETAWNIQYRVAGGENEWVTINNVTANPYTFTGLTAATDYEVQVQAACSATEQSEYSNSATFTTLCEVVATFPYVENFDGLTTSGQIPNCWNNDEGTTTNDTYKWSYNSSYGTGVTGTCVRFDSYVNSSGNTNFLKSPVLALPAGQIMMLSFQWKNPAGGDFSVYISTDGGQTHETALATGLTAQSSWKSEEISLAAYTGQNVVIVFKGTSNYGSNDARIYLDDVTVYEAPSCLKPTDVAVANITNTSAEISWVAGGTETSWNIQYRVAGGENEWVTINNVTANPYTFTGLTAATNYEVQIQSACSATDQSEWTNSVSFTTSICANEDQCQIMIVMEDEYGDGWNGNSMVYFVESTTNIVAGYAKLEGSGDDDTFIDTAYVNVCNALTYNIMWQTGSYDYEDSFTIYGVVGDVIYTSGTLSAGQLGSFTASCTIPNCMPVQNVAVNNITKNTAVVTWSLLDATESNFVVAYGTGIDPTTMATVNATTNSATLTGLTAGTYYNVFVKAVCSATDESDWSPMATFMTACDAFDFTTGDTLIQSFANGLECWTAYSANTENLNNFGLNINAIDGDSASFMMSSYNEADDYNQYLISQELHSTTPMTIGFYAAVASQYSSGESFRVVYSTTDNEISSFTGVALDTTLTTVMTWCPFTAAIPANAKYVAINYYSDYMYYLAVDYIFIIAEAPVIETYNITIADNISNGTVVASEETAEAGETITLTATPAQGYHLDSYLVTATADNTQVVTVTGDSFVMPAFDVTVNAFFAPDPAEIYTITIDADIENGTIEASATEAEEGETITLTATPAAEHELVAFNVYKTGDATATVTVTNNTFVMPAFDVTVSATFSYDAVGENAAESAAIYPNPSNGNVKVAANGMVNVTIFNAMGQVISNVDIEADEYEFNFENAGVYMMQIATTTGTATKRVVIVK